MSYVLDILIRNVSKWEYYFLKQDSSGYCVLKLNQKLNAQLKAILSMWSQFFDELQKFSE